jgi:hypothetical protein
MRVTIIMKIVQSESFSFSFPEKSEEMAETLITIGNLTQKCVRGHGGWKQKELYDEAVRRGVKVRKYPSKEELCKALSVSSPPYKEDIMTTLPYGEEVQLDKIELDEEEDIVPNAEDLLNLGVVPKIKGLGRRFESTVPKDTPVEEERYILWLFHFASNLGNVTVVDTSLEDPDFSKFTRENDEVLILFRKEGGTRVVFVDNNMDKAFLLLPSGEGTFSVGLETTPIPYSEDIEKIGAIVLDVYPETVYEVSPISRNCPDFVKLRGLQDSWNFFALALALLNSDQNEVLNEYTSKPDRDLELQLRKFKTYVDSVTPTLEEIESLDFLNAYLSQRAITEIAFFIV